MNLSLDLYQATQRTQDDFGPALDNLSVLGRELSDDHLEQVTGALLPIIGMFVAGFGAGFSGAMLVDLATG